MTDPTEILEVSEACDIAAGVVAGIVCRNLWQESPEFVLRNLDPEHLWRVASRELFDAARMVADVAMREAGVA